MTGPFGPEITRTMVAVSIGIAAVGIAMPFVERGSDSWSSQIALAVIFLAAIGIWGLLIVRAYQRIKEGKQDRVDSE